MAQQIVDGFIDLDGRPISQADFNAKVAARARAAEEKRAALDSLNTPELIEQRRRRATVLRHTLRGESVTSIWQTMLVDRKDLKLDTVVEDLLEVMRDFHDKVIADATADVKRYQNELKAAEARQAGRVRRSQ